MQGVKALIFDVFGTLVDWRTCVARESKKILEPLGYKLDWIALADAWRGEYQPAWRKCVQGHSLREARRDPSAHAGAHPSPLRSAG